MTNHDFEQLTSRVMSLAEEASATIMSFYQKPLQVIQKSDGSPVTQADQASHEILAQGLADVLPGARVVSEEGDLEGELPEYFWLVDPLDGTRGYIKENDEFTINIALMHNKQPIWGMIYHPPTGDVYWGFEDQAFEKKDEKLTRLHTSPPQETGCRLLMGRHCDDRYTKQKALVLEDFAIDSCDHFGSALKFCFLAKGDYDLYIRLAPSCEWDVAAGHAIVKGASGTLTNLDGSPFVYGKKAFLNPGFIVRGSSS